MRARVSVFGWHYCCVLCKQRTPDQQHVPHAAAAPKYRNPVKFQYSASPKPQQNATFSACGVWGARPPPQTLDPCSLCWYTDHPARKTLDPCLRVLVLYSLYAGVVGRADSATAPGAHHHTSPEPPARADRGRFALCGRCNGLVLRLHVYRLLELELARMNTRAERTRDELVEPEQDEEKAQKSRELEAERCAAPPVAATSISAPPRLPFCATFRSAAT